MAVSRRVDALPVKSQGTADLFDRQPPQNVEVEQQVLGSLMLDPELCDEVSLIVRADDFYAPAHQKLFHHILELHNDGTPLDPTLLVNRLKSAGDFEFIGGVSYLAEVMQSVATAANAEYYARVIREKATLRNLIHCATEMLGEAFNPANDARDVLSRAEQNIFAINDSRSANEVHGMNSIVQEAFDRIARRIEKGASDGLATGFTDLDGLTGGLQNSELVILAARPSMGKTALATNIVQHVTLHSNLPALFVSLEMSRLELVDRMLCSLAEVDAHKVRKGHVSQQDRQKLIQRCSELSQTPLFVDDTPARRVTEIAANARRLKRRHGLGLLVVDYLQLIEPDNASDPRQEQVAKVARRLKGLARELEIPVLCLAQLNRQAEASKDNRPRLSHLRESGAIEQDADVVMFVHREEYYHTQEDAQRNELVGKAEIIIGKQRNGPIGDVPLRWEAKYTKFQDVAGDRFSDFDDYADDPFLE
jgi:replicative DNA helicase